MDNHDKADLIMKILIVIIAGFYFWLLLDEDALTKETEYEKFCKNYMVWVVKYPDIISAGCCDIHHPSNDRLKEGWKGETLLICYGKEIV